MLLLETLKRNRTAYNGFCDGKTVQVREASGKGKWIIDPTPVFTNQRLEYRVLPEPKYIPWDIKTCPQVPVLFRGNEWMDLRDYMWIEDPINVEGPFYADGVRMNWFEYALKLLEWSPKYSNGPWEKCGIFVNPAD